MRAVPMAIGYNGPILDVGATKLEKATKIYRGKQSVF